MHALTRLMTALLAVTVISTAVAPASQAHAGLTSSDPQPGSVLTVPPASVTLTFSEELVTETVNVAISSELGPLEGIVPTTDGPVVTVPWPAEVGDGAYTVAYRVVSQDGHPVDGSFDFTVGAAAAEEVVASEAPYEPTGPADGSVNWLMVIVVMLFGIAAFLALLIAGRKNARRKW